jgi:citrate lyase synthetase
LKIAQDAQDAANLTINSANEEASIIAGSAIDAKENAKLYEKTVTAMKNIIHGYGNEYLISSRSLPNFYTLGQG